MRCASAVCGKNKKGAVNDRRPFLRDAFKQARAEPGKQPCLELVRCAQLDVAADGAAGVHRVVAEAAVGQRIGRCNLVEDLVYASLLLKISIGKFYVEYACYLKEKNR